MGDRPGHLRGKCFRYSHWCGSRSPAIERWLLQPLAANTMALHEGFWQSFAGAAQQQAELTHSRAPLPGQENR